MVKREVVVVPPTCTDPDDEIVRAGLPVTTSSTWTVTKSAVTIRRPSNLNQFRFAHAEMAVRSGCRVLELLKVAAYLTRPPIAPRVYCALGRQCETMRITCDEQRGEQAVICLPSTTAQLYKSSHAHQDFCSC